MRYVAEVTIRTEPFEAKDADQARELARPTSVELGYFEPLSWLASQIVEVSVTELEDTD